jgi:hypothetical protein
VYSSSQQERIRLARAEVRQSQVEGIVGDYLQNLLQWAWFVTITIPNLRERPSALAQVRGYLRDLECAARRAIGWALVVELSPLALCYHAHILIAGVSNLHRTFWWRKAFQRFGRSEVRPFDRDRGAAHYLAKNAVNGSRRIYLGGGLLPPPETGSRKSVSGVTIVRAVKMASSSLYRTVGQREKRSRNRSGSGYASAQPANRIYVDGSGMRPGGTGSGYAWVNRTTGYQYVKRIDGLTNNEAEYGGLLSAVEHLTIGASAEIFSDSQLVCCQFHGKWAVRDPRLEALLRRAPESEAHLGAAK